MLKKGTPLYAVFKIRCPRCHEGKLFKLGIYNMKKFGKMDAHCSHCGLKYSREPGFFFGSAYVSYALTVAFATAITVLFAIVKYTLFPVLSWYWLILCIVIALIVLFPLSFAVSRAIWLVMNVKYDPEKRGEK